MNGINRKKTRQNVRKRVLWSELEVDERLALLREEDDTHADGIVDEPTEPAGFDGIDGEAMLTRAVQLFDDEHHAIRGLINQANPASRGVAA